MQSFSDVIDGMKEACEMFETPVVSGNVSFYNETDGRGILPTPVIGMVGLIEDTRKIITQGFKDEGDIIALLGTTNDDLSVSEYAQTILGFSTDELIESGEVPVIDLDLEKKVQRVCLDLVKDSLINSAHDCSDGGLAVTIAESCFSSLNRKSIGAKIELKSENSSTEVQFFSESPSRIVISFAPENLEKVKEIAADCPFEVLGKVSGEDLSVKFNDEKIISAKITDLENIWKNSLKDKLEN